MADPKALAYSAPFDAAGLLAFFAARAVPGIEVVEGGTYRRSVRLPHGPAVVAMRAGAATWTLEAGDERDAPAAERLCRAMLDLEADPHAVDALLARDPLLAPLVAAVPGRRVSGTA